MDIEYNILYTTLNIDIMYMEPIIRKNASSNLELYNIELHFYRYSGKLDFLYSNY